MRQSDQTCRRRIGAGVGGCQGRCGADLADRRHFRAQAKVQEQIFARVPVPLKFSRQLMLFVMVGLVQVLLDWAVFSALFSLGVPLTPANALGRVWGSTARFVTASPGSGERHWVHC